MDEIPRAAPDGTQCIQCGLHLRGIRIDGACPKCRTPLSRTLGALPKTVPDAATCIRCAYSLKGLEPDGICPECGTHIARSLKGDLLAYSDPAYIRRLLAGARIVFWSTLAILGVSIFVLFARWSGDRSLIRLLPMFLLVGFSAFLAGWWLLTWPDVAQISANKGQAPRRVVRITVVAIVAFFLADAMAPSLMQHSRSELLELFALIVYPVMLVGFWAGMRYIRWLAPRIPDGRVHARAKILLFLFASIVISLVLSIAFGFFALANRGNGFELILACLAVAGLATVVSIIMYCRLFYLLRISLEAITRLNPRP